MSTPSNHPFTSEPEKSVGALGEIRLLEQIRQWLGPAAPSAPHGMGDDCAVTRARTNLLTNDSLVYLRHFDDAVSAADAGAKLLKRNLSDIAAMGGTPEDAVVALFLPPQVSQGWLEAFTRGLACCAVHYGVRIVGGDITETDGFLAGTLTLTGWKHDPLLRTGAVEGAAIYVTGELGGSIRGHHYSFEPRLGEGQFLGARPGVLSCIDVTDGLAKDLRHLLPEGMSAQLDPSALPASKAAKEQARASGMPLIEHLLTDGEDYELLFTFSPDESTEALQEAWRKNFKTRLTRIGKVVPEGVAPLLDLEGNPLTTRGGYEHLRPTP